jgi:hypothetical protein
MADTDTLGGEVHKIAIIMELETLKLIHGALQVLIAEIGVAIGVLFVIATRIKK